MVTVKLPKTAQKQGIGLYTYEQTKNTTPFQISLKSSSAPLLLC